MDFMHQMEYPYIYNYLDLCYRVTSLSKADLRTSP